MNTPQGAPNSGGGGGGGGGVYDTEEAYEAIKASLALWTSPKVGRRSTSPPPPLPPVDGLEDDHDAMMMMTMEDEEEDYEPSSSSTRIMTTPTATTVKKRRSLERSPTPVMSNSSSKKSRSPDVTAATPPPTTTTKTKTTMMLLEQPHSLPLPTLTSPSSSSSWQLVTTTSSSSSLHRPGRYPSSIGQRTPSAYYYYNHHHHNDTQEYQHYHKILETFVQDKHDFAKRTAPYQNEQVLTAAAAAAATPTTGRTGVNVVEDNDGDDEDDEDIMEFTMESISMLPPSQKQAATTTATNNENEQQQEQNRIGLEQEQQQQQQLELDYLQALNRSCWKFQHEEEGNFWSLLFHLRSVGKTTTAALLWPDDEASQRQYIQTISGYLQECASSFHSQTPLELMQSAWNHDTYTTTNNNTERKQRFVSCPLSILRRRVLVEWMQSCFQFQHETSNQQQNQYENDKSQNHHKTMSYMLSLVLAGRLQDARQAITKAGQPWKAAMWAGGQFLSIQSLSSSSSSRLEDRNMVMVGNLHRPLWKRQMYQLSQQMHQDVSHSTDNNTKEEAAIHAILANDTTTTAMANPALRTWQKSLYLLLHARWERMEDKLLFLQQQQQQRSPSSLQYHHRHQPHQHHTSSFLQTREHLQETLELEDMTEGDALDILSHSPFEQVQKGCEALHGAMEAFLMGQSAIHDFLDQERHYFASFTNNNTHHVDSDEKDPKHISRLRFLTHLMIYLDTILDSSTFGLNDLKNQTVFLYLQHLASREDLWNLCILYASLLPETILLDYLPTVLVTMEGTDLRQTIVSQLSKLMTTSLTERILIKVVQQMIHLSSSSSLSDKEEEYDDDDGRVVDVKKMRSIQWLTLNHHHFHHALSQSNALLRQFFLANKMQCAITFVEEYLPEDLLQKPDDGGTTTTTTAANAQVEHVAYLSYINAHVAVEEWRDVLEHTSPTTTTTSMSGSQEGNYNNSTNNSMEKEIATSMERRTFAKNKRRSCHAMIQAADLALQRILDMLTHPGGWLLSTNHSSTTTSTKDENNMSMQEEEIVEIRQKCLPRAVFLFHDVCKEMSDWMAQSLQDAIPILGTSSTDVLQVLDKNSAEDDDLSPFSQLYWTGKALQLVEYVATQGCILDAFGATELKEFLTSVSDMALTDLMLQQQQQETEATTTITPRDL